MFNKTIKTFFCLAMIFNFWTQALCSDLNLTAQQKAIENIAYNSNNFGFRFLNQLALEESKNIIISPFNINQSFAVTYLGAKKETHKEIETVFNFDNSKGIFHTLFSDLGRNLLRENPHYTFTVSNKLYVADGSNILLDYKKNILNIYNFFADEGTFSYTDNSNISSINGAIEKTSNNKIKQILSEENIKDGTKIVLTSTTYMKGKWLKPFDPKLTTVGHFKSSDGKMTQISTMNLQSIFNFTESYDFYSIEIPYASTQTSMIVILPKKRFNFVLENIESVYSYILEASEPSMINLKLPKFKIESDVSTLQRTFVAMGLKHFFGNKPDFSGMSEEKNFSFGEIYHKGYLEVNEDGTEVSTAVVMVGSKSSFHPKVRALELNQPFIVVIRDTKTSQILFVGAVRKL